MRKGLAIGLPLLALVTVMSVASFRWYYSDFFYLRQVYRAPQPADTERLLEIVKKRYHEHQSNTAMSMMLGHALMRAGETEAAIRVIHQQMIMNWGDEGILLAYADALSANGDTELAAKYYRALEKKRTESLPQLEKESR